MKLSPIQHAREALFIGLLLSPVLADIGCQHIGPPSIENDRLAYNKAIVTSWKEQALLNIVRARYDDLFAFVDVGPVIQTHTLTGMTQASFGASLFPWDKIMNTLTPGLSGSRATTDSPAITYTPLTGSEFTRNVITAIKPAEIFNLIESNFEADALLNLTLYSIDDINNVILLSSSDKSPRQSDALAKRSPTFKKLTRAIACAHLHGDLSFYAEVSPSSGNTKVFMIIEDKDSKTCLISPFDPVEFIRQTLHLRAGATKFEIVPGPHPMKEDEIAVRTRSVAAAIRWLSNYVPDPYGNPRQEAGKLLNDQDELLPLKVKASTEKPPGAFAAVKYRDYWFWIPQSHEHSKFSLIYLRVLLALADTAAKPSPPVLTIPTR